MGHWYSRWSILKRAYWLGKIPIDVVCYCWLRCILEQGIYCSGFDPETLVEAKLSEFTTRETLTSQIKLRESLLCMAEAVLYVIRRLQGLQHSGVRLWLL